MIIRTIRFNYIAFDRRICASEAKQFDNQCCRASNLFSAYFYSLVAVFCMSVARLFFAAQQLNYILCLIRVASLYFCESIIIDNSPKKEKNTLQSELKK